MTSRVLPIEDWSRVSPLFGQLPATSRVMVVEAGDQIVGRWVLMPIWHAEFLEIAPSHQGNASVARHLWRTMRHLTREAGITAVYTGALDDTVKGLLAHVGARKLPGDHYIWEMTPCPSASAPRR